MALIISLLPLGLWATPKSQRCVIFDAYTNEVGFVMTDRIIEQFIKNKWLDTTKSLSVTEIQSRIERYIIKHNRSADVSLSEKIIQVAQSTGIDPFVFTSLIKAESTFKKNAKSHTGALGLTQMTKIAFKELRDQLGVGDSNFNPMARDHFIAMIHDYYKDTRATQRFIDFIASTKNPKNTIQVIHNVGFSLLSGALLFKLKLALSHGDYRRALERYNGSRDKVPYSIGILKSTRNEFLPVSLNCMDIHFSNPIIGDSCELSGDSRFCQRYLGIITL